MRRRIDNIIDETINSYLQRNLIREAEGEGTNPVFDSEEDNNKPSDKKKKKKKFRKNAIKLKGGLRKDFDVEDDETYNKQISDKEMANVANFLKNKYINLKAVAEDVYPDHTPEGAQSQLRKEVWGEVSDSGSVYKIKTKTLKKLKSVLNSMFNSYKTN